MNILLKPWYLLPFYSVQFIKIISNIIYNRNIWFMIYKQLNIIFLLDNVYKITIIQTTL